MHQLYRLHRPLVLASASPRRRELLSRLGIAYDVSPADIEETVDADKPAMEVAMELAGDKARYIAAKYKEAAVIGADTIVVCDNVVLSKPVDEQDARAMLHKLSGRWHEVMTGLCITCDGHDSMACDVTRVRFVPLTKKEVDAYIKTGDPMDKAGAYGIQGMAGCFIDRIEGDYYNVMGLPLARLRNMLLSGGILR